MQGSEYCYQILTIIGAISILLALCIFSYFIKSIAKHNREMLKIMQYNINVANTTNADAQIQGYLDGIIAECFTDYRVMTLEPLVTRNNIYITEEQEREIQADLASMVSERISEAAFDKLSQRYSRINMGKIIADKISIVVTGYVLERNKIISSK